MSCLYYKGNYSNFFEKGIDYENHGHNINKK